MSYDVHISGFETKQQAESFVEWYKTQRSQISEVCFAEDESLGVTVVTTTPTTYVAPQSVAWQDNVLRVGLHPNYMSCTAECNITK